MGIRNIQHSDFAEKQSCKQATFDKKKYAVLPNKIIQSNDNIRIVNIVSLFCDEIANNEIYNQYGHSNNKPTSLNGHETTVCDLLYQISSRTSLFTYIRHRRKERCRQKLPKTSTRLLLSTINEISSEQVAQI